MDSANREKKRLTTQAWRAANQERARSAVAACWADPVRRSRYNEKKKEYSRKNAALAIARSRAWAEAHREDAEAKSLRAARASEYRRAFPEKHCATEGKRRAAKLQRTPCWVGAEEIELIEWAYKFAKVREQMLGGRWHVDHFLPLQGASVSGLHVVENLRVIPGLLNLRKHAKFIGDCQISFF